MANRTIIFYKNHFKEFYLNQLDGVKRKINYCLTLVKTVDRIPASVFKSIQSISGLYEIRVEYSGNIYRIFCCFDETSIVVLFNGFQKKSQKTPQRELDKARKIMIEYFKEKENGQK